jgi:hypothetical protein
MNGLNASICETHAFTLAVSRNDLSVWPLNRWSKTGLTQDGQHGGNGCACPKDCWGNGEQPNRSGCGKRQDCLSRGLVGKPDVTGQGANPDLPVSACDIGDQVQQWLW